MNVRCAAAASKVVSIVPSVQLMNEWMKNKEKNIFFK